MSNTALDAAIDAAYEALYEERLDEAKAGLDKARRIDAKAAEVRLLEIDILEADGMGEEAISAAEEANGALPKSMVVKLRLATLLLDAADDVVGAQPLLEDLWARLEKGEKPDVATGEGAAEAAVDFHLEVALTLADVRGASHDPKGAHAVAERAVKLAPDDAMARVALAASLFDLGELQQAGAVVAQALDRDPRLPDAFWLRGRILTAQEDHAGADKAFERAIALDPERFQEPFRASEDEFAALMEESLDQLPPPVQKYLKNVAVVVEDVPDAAALKKNDPPLSPGSLGLFEGTPPSMAPGADPWAHFPSRITLYRKNIEISCSNEDELRDVVSTTLLHEVGHYLGLDEDDLYERGLG